MLIKGKSNSFYKQNSRLRHQLCKIKSISNHLSLMELNYVLFVFYLYALMISIWKYDYNMGFYLSKALARQCETWRHWLLVTVNLLFHRLYRWTPGTQRVVSSTAVSGGQIERLCFGSVIIKMTTTMTISMTMTMATKAKNDNDNIFFIILEVGL